MTTTAVGQVKVASSPLGGGPVERLLKRYPSVWMQGVESAGGIEFVL
jgi:hypothetical protein